MCDSNCCAAGIGQLRTVLENLEHETDTVSRLLVRLLHVRDKRAGRLVAQYGKLTLVLRHFARRNSECVLLYQPLYSETSEYRTVWGLAKSPLFGGIMWQNHSVFYREGSLHQRFHCIRDESRPMASSFHLMSLVFTTVCLSQVFQGTRSCSLPSIDLNHQTNTARWERREREKREGGRSVQIENKDSDHWREQSPIWLSNFTRLLSTLFLSMAVVGSLDRSLAVAKRHSQTLEENGISILLYDYLNV